MVFNLFSLLPGVTGYVSNLVKEDFDILLNKALKDDNIKKKLSAIDTFIRVEKNSGDHSTKCRFKGIAPAIFLRCIKGIWKRVKCSIKHRSSFLKYLLQKNTGTKSCFIIRRCSRNDNTFMWQWYEYGLAQQ